MQTRPVVVTAQFFYVYLYVAYAMSAVYHHINPFAVGHFTDFPDREDLPGYINHVANHDQPCFRRNDVFV